MTLIHVPVGHKVMVGKNNYNPGGRLFASNPRYVYGDLMSDAAWNDTGGVAACSNYSDSVIQFLTEKATGARLLVYMAEATVGSWGSQFRAWAASKGHTLTFAGEYNTGSGIFNGYDPQNYDAFLVNGLLDSAGAGAEYDAMQTYLTQQGGRVWTLVNRVGSSAPWLARYGIALGDGSFDGGSLFNPFDCAPLVGSPVSTVYGAHVNANQGNVTVGGTVTGYFLNAHPTNSAAAIWRQD